MKFNCPGCGVEINLSDDYNEIWFCPFCTAEIHFGEDDDYDEESLSAHDAALIWASHGKDDDYSFGFNSEELESELD